MVVLEKTFLLPGARPRATKKWPKLLMPFDTLSQKAREVARDILRNKDGSAVAVLFLLGMLSVIGLPHARNLSAPQLGMWNGYLSQNNIIECVNTGGSFESVDILVLDAQGESLDQHSLGIPPKGSAHVSLPQSLTSDRYGSYQVSAKQTIHCATAVYRSSFENPEHAFDYAYFLPAVELQRGTAAGLYNSMNPNIALAPVQNWLSIYNPEQNPLELKIELYDSAGQPRENGTVLSLQGGERRDIALGHEQGYQLGLYKITPTQMDQDYAASLVRYSKSTNNSYTFAFPVHAGAGLCDSGHIPASTMDPAINWGEIANLDSSSTRVLLEIFDASGTLLHEEQKEIEAHAQFHVPLTDFLGPRSVGSFRVRCIEAAEEHPGLLAQSLFYGLSSQDSSELLWAYAAQGVRASDENCTYFTPVNTHLRSANWLKTFNRHNAELHAHEEIYNAAGEKLPAHSLSTYSLASGASFDSGIHSSTGADFVGLTSIRSDSRARANVSSIRVFPSLIGGISTIMNAPVYEGQCGPDTPQRSEDGCEAVSLKDAAACRGVRVGSPMWEFYDPRMVDISKRESSVITATAYWHRVRPNENTFDFSRTDAQIEFAESLGLPVHGHPLLWAENAFIPDWVQAQPAARAEELLRTHIRTVAERYRGRIAVWDVVNEAANDTGSAHRRGYWLDSIGPGYLKMAFDTAHQADPNALLIYNDYGMEWNEPKFLYILDMLTELLEQGTPIHGIGWQMHVDAGFDHRDELYLRMQQFSELGLKNYITELDVRLREDTPAERERQLRAYQMIAEAFLAVDNRGYFQTWGYADRYSWLNDFIGPGTAALIWDDSFKEKEIYEVLFQTFLQNPEMRLEPLLGTRRISNPNSVNEGSFLHQSYNEEGAEAMVLPLRIAWGSQKWVITEKSEGKYKIYCQWGENYLQAADAEQSYEVSVAGHRPGDARQEWRILRLRPSHYLIQNVATGEYLTSTNYDWGGRLSLEPKNQSESQTWLIEHLK